jgi:hypothetical protein
MSDIYGLKREPTPEEKLLKDIYGIDPDEVSIDPWEEAVRAVERRENLRRENLHDDD